MSRFSGWEFCLANSLLKVKGGFILVWAANISIGRVRFRRGEKVWVGEGSFWLPPHKRREKLWVLLLPRNEIDWCPQVPTIRGEGIQVVILRDINMLVSTERERREVPHFPTRRERAEVAPYEPHRPNTGTVRNDWQCEWVTPTRLLDRTCCLPKVFSLTPPDIGSSLSRSRTGLV